MQILVKAGVKQGCPLSMVLFIVCIDPLIRYMNSRVSPADGKICAYCDDIALAALDLARALNRLRRPFRVAADACNLWLNSSKTQILPLAAEGEDAIRMGLLGPINYLAGATVDDAVLLLGAWIGPGAGRVQWKNTLDKF